MFFPGVGLFLAGEHLQISTDPLACGWGLNDIIHKACETHSMLHTHVAGEPSTSVLQWWQASLALWRLMYIVSVNNKNVLCTSDSSGEGIGKLLHIFSFSLGLILLSSEDDLNCTLKNQMYYVAHYIDLFSWFVQLLWIFKLNSQIWSWRNCDWLRFFFFVISWPISIFKLSSIKTNGIHRNRKGFFCFWEI